MEVGWWGRWLLGERNSKILLSRNNLNSVSHMHTKGRHEIESGENRRIYKLELTVSITSDVLLARMGFQFLGHDICWDIHPYAMASAGVIQLI